MPTFNNQGFSIGYTSLEKSFDRNVLFIHGNLASKEWWYPSMEIMKAKAGKGTLLAADWRGYGESKGIESVGEIDFETCASDFIALLEDQKLSDVHLVGHSTGGMIAMMAVLQKPDLFKSLTLLDSVGATGLELELPKEQVLAHFNNMSIDKDYCQMVLAATIKNCKTDDSSFQKLFEITWNCDKAMWQGVIEVLSEKIDFTAKMNQLTLPTLILHGDEDVVLPMKMAEHTHSLLPQSILKVMDGQGHSMNMENPKRLVSELESFWSGL